ncbi:MAG TPA: hypothetical protein VMV31_10030 [Terriglobales bacterium]|nr:hypothetical protein [Terriglobales bacterium]
MLVHQDAPQLFGQGDLPEGLALAHPLPVIAAGFSFIVEIEAQHVAGLAGGAHRQGRCGRLAAQVIHLAGDVDRA